MKFGYFLYYLTIIAITYCLTTGFLNAQPITQSKFRKPDPKEYRDYPNKSKKIVFFDDFDNNKQRWNLKMDGRYSSHKIYEGYYYLTSKDSLHDETSGRYNAQEIDLIDSLDFEIEGGFRMISAIVDTATYGLLWGRNLCCEHNLNVSINGRFSVAHFEFGWQYERRPNVHKSVYYNNAYNRLTMRKVDSMCYFFVNKNLVHQSLFREFYGNKIGFWVSNGATVAADYLKIAYLPKLISLDTTQTPIFVTDEKLPTSISVKPPPTELIKTAPTVAALPPPPPYQHRMTPDSLAKRKVIYGKQMYLHDTEVKLHLWDKDYEDGDRVAIFCNGKWVTEDCLLKNERTTFLLHLDPNGDNYLVFCIVSEGSRPSNTVGMSIDDGVQERALLLSSDKRICESVKFVLPK